MKLSLQCRRILGGRKLLVYVRSVVNAIFFMTEDDKDPAPFDSPHFLPSFRASTGAFASAPEENACTAGHMKLI